MDRIIVSDLLLRGLIGFQPWETEKRQDVLINLTLFTDTRPAAASDQVADALDYKAITKQVIALVEQGGHVNLVESLAEQIARLCISGGAQRVIVRVEKPGALRFARSVGVEIERDVTDYGR